MYSMHHRNSAAWGREAEEKREREEKKKKTNNKGEKQNKKEEEKNEKKKHERKERREKKMRKERGYVGILNTLLPLYSSGGSNLGNLVLTGRRGLTKAGLVPRIHWAEAARGGGRAAPLTCPSSIQLRAPGPSATGQSWAKWEKKEEKLPLFFPHRRRQVQ